MRSLLVSIVSLAMASALAGSCAGQSHSSENKRAGAAARREPVRAATTPIAVEPARRARAGAVAPRAAAELRRVAVAAAKGARVKAAPILRGSAGATLEEIRSLVRNTRSHASGAYIYITGLPFYDEGNVCPLWGPDGPQFTDELAQQMAAEDPNVHYVGPLGPLEAGEYESDLCHANVMGEDKLGMQVRAIWGQP